MKKLFAFAIIGVAVLCGLGSTANATQDYVINGTTFPFPDVDDQDWGQNVTDWAGAVTRGMFQLKSGTFPLTTEAWFGPTYGLKSLYFKSTVPQPSTSGWLRMGTTDYVGWRNSANTGDIKLGVNTSGYLQLDGRTIPNTSSATFNNFTANVATIPFLSGTTFYPSAIVWPNGTIQVASPTAGGGGGAQTASTSTALYDLVVTTVGTDTNKLAVTASGIDIMGCYFTNFSTIAAMNLAISGGAGGGGSNLADPASTWHSYFAAAKTDCSTPTVILDSANVLTPTLPTGYTKYRHLGDVYNDSSSNIRPIFKRGRTVSQWQYNTVINAAAAALTYTEVNFEGVIPPRATTVFFHGDFTSAGSQTTVRCMLKFKGAFTPTVAVGDDSAIYGFQNISATQLLRTDLIFHPLGDRTLMYKSDNTNFCVSIDLYLKGYEEDY